MSQIELNFVLRSIADAMHFFSVHNRAKVVMEGEEHVLRTQDINAALALVEHLLGGGETPEQLPRQLGMRAALEARGDPKAIELYEKWKALSCKPSDAARQ